MASTRATSAAALTRLPASLSLSRTVPRAAAGRTFGSWARATAAAGNGAKTGLGMGAWKGMKGRGAAVEARRWKSESNKAGDEVVTDAPAKEVGFDEVVDIVNHAAASRPRMKQYLSDQEQPLLVDVRSPAEYAAGAIPSAVNLPVNSHVDALFAAPDDFEDRLGFPKPDEHRKLVFYCKAGVRSHAAAQVAKQAGYTQVAEYPGSWLDWTKRGGEVVVGQDLLKEKEE